MTTTHQINDGGPAFPSPPIPSATDERSEQRDDMSLRDWFAGQANEEDIQKHQVFYHVAPTDGVIPPRLKSTYTREQARYRFADAMLAARNNQPSA